MFSKRSKDPELSDLSAKEALVKEEMNRLKSFITEGAEIKQQDQLNTLPPPDDFDQRAREHIHMDKVLSNREFRNMKRRQSKGLLLLILLAIAITTLSSWLFRVYSDHFAN